MDTACANTNNKAHELLLVPLMPVLLMKGFKRPLQVTCVSPQPACSSHTHKEPPGLGCLELCNTRCARYVSQLLTDCTAKSLLESLVACTKLSYSIHLESHPLVSRQRPA